MPSPASGRSQAFLENVRLIIAILQSNECAPVLLI